MKNNFQSTKRLPKNIGGYQIIEEIGRGGMGCVYKAYHSQLNQFIAIKVILTNIVQKEEQQRFLREAKTLSKLSHPNIIKLYDIGVEQQNPYFTMELIEGAPLSQYLTQTPLNIRRFSKLMIKIARAVCYAHSKNIIHRDLKPSNILIDQKEEPQLVDFGLAKFTKDEKSITKTGEMLGTPQYMSPQQAMAKKADHLSDIYALGAIFYEMLCGKMMVNGETVAQLLYQVIYEEPTSLREINPKIAIDLETICQKCIAKDPIARYQSGSEFADDLEKFLNGEAIAALRPSFYKCYWQRLKRYKGAVILVVLMCLPLVYLNISWYLKRKQKANEYIQKSQKLLATNAHLDTYIQAKNYLSKAKELFPKNQEVNKKLFKVYQQMSKVALKHKEYLLAQIAVVKMRKLGFLPQATRLQKQMQTQKQKQQLKHQDFIAKAMKNITMVKNEDLLDWYAFQFVKMDGTHVVKLLIPYLHKNFWQRKLAIRALGKQNNTYTKVEGKDSVEWLLKLLQRHLSTIKDKSEVEELINALGLLKDHRANDLIEKVRSQVGGNSPLWQKTKIAYAMIPIKSKKPRKAVEFFIRGQRKQYKRNLPGAIADFTQAIALNPKLPSPYIGRGATYMTQGKLQKAIADFTQAIALDPSLPRPYINRGISYEMQGQLQKAIADYTQAIILNPKSAMPYNSRGIAHRKQKNLQGAMADYTQAIVLDPKFFTAYINRGITRYEQGNVVGAMADFTQAIKLNPKYPLAYVNRGKTYQLQGNITKAIIDYSKAITLSPKFLDAYMNRGTAHQTQGNLAKANADFSQIIRFNPKFFVAYINRGVVRQALRDMTGAMADFNQAIKLNPKYSLAYNNRGMFRKSQKDIVGAIADFTQAIKLNPKLSQAYTNRGNARQAQKDFINAIADFTQAIKINSKSIEAYINRGIARQTQGDLAGAISDCTKAYYALKNLKALEDFQMFVKLAPNHPLSFKLRAILQKHGK